LEKLMSKKTPGRRGTIFLIVLACVGAVACAKSSTDQTPQVPTAFATLRFNPDGTLDTNATTGFGAGTGKVITDLDPAVFDFAVAVALQGTSIIVAGQTVVNGQAAIAVARYSSLGVLDTTFGTLGIVRTVVGSGTAGASSVVVQPDGKILVAATTFNGSTSTTGFVLVRYNSTDGSLDTNFNGNGVVIGPTIGLGSAQDAVSLALQGTKIIVAGADSSGSFVLARFTTTGALDLTFGGTATPGTVTTPLGAVGIGAMPPAIALQSNGIVAAGGVGNFDTLPMNAALVRYSVDGVPDTTFGGGNSGIVITPVGSGINYANAVAVQPDDKIVVVGHANVNLSTGTSDIAVLRYKLDGTLDTDIITGFGQGTGMVVTDLGGFDNAFSVALQPSDGKIVVSGNSINSVAVNLVVLRYNTDGSQDTNFGPSPGGLVVAGPIGPSNVTSGNAVAVQADGKIVTAGYD
jgi:uncharacterized delta-60 repeat protein